MSRQFVTCFITAIFLFISGFTNCVYGMRKDRLSGKPGKILNFPKFLKKLQKKFSCPEAEDDLNTMRYVLLQYHPDEDGNIRGRNLQKLLKMAGSSLKEFSVTRPYHQMLKEINSSNTDFVFTPDLDDESFIDKNATKCSICLSGAKEPVTLETCCKNQFCFMCLFGWYSVHEAKNDCHTKCPCCRKPLPLLIVEKFKKHESYKKIRIQNNVKKSKRRIRQIAEDEDLVREMSYLSLD